MKNDGWKLEDSRFPFGMVSDHKQTVKLPGSNPLHKKQARNTTTDGTCSSVNFSTFLGVPKDMRKKGCEESLEKQCKNFHACVFLSPEVVHCFSLCVFGYLVVYGILDGYKLTLYSYTKTSWRSHLVRKHMAFFGGSWRNQRLSLWRPVKIGLKNKNVFTRFWLSWNCHQSIYIKTKESNKIYSGSQENTGSNVRTNRNHIT